MSSSAANAAGPTAAGPTPEYVVVARRYRPRTFDELIGQQHVAQALSNAISTHRVGHAYLFTGARGVGKTSAARIFAKALNCVEGSSPTPCDQCDLCRGISTGDDVDVLEIDGASNRGIDEIRQLRQNVNVRPSRSRFKIYIIDEVHMLTREAFNALLKTLEEPPEHVKFIFCTTEPTKIPITILSRCQRFDFAGIVTDSIVERLRQIVAAEGVEADDAALQVLAQRAAGSMRDSQSLLEQLLAFAPGRISVDDVHRLLGTAGDERLAALAGHLAAHDAASALAELAVATNEGIDPGQLLEQLLGYLRDCMLAAVGCPPEQFIYCSPANRQAVVELGGRWGLQTVLAAMQVLDHTLSRMRLSTQGRLLAELALVRIAALEDLDELPRLIAQLQSGAASADGGRGQRSAASRPAAGGYGEKKKPEFPRGNGSIASAEEGVSNDGAPTGPSPAVQMTLSSSNAHQVWAQALEQLPGLNFEHARHFSSVGFVEPDTVVVRFKAGFVFQKSLCERPDMLRSFEQALHTVTGTRVRLTFVVEEGVPEQPPQPAAAARGSNAQQRLLELGDHPLVRRAGELFGAEPVRVDSPSPKE